MVSISNESTLAHSGHNHICAFFHGQREEYDVLLPFIKQGLAQGEKAFHIVDPARHKEHLRYLEMAGIDVKATEARRQLEVKVWKDTDRFTPHEMVILVEEALKSGRSQGFCSTSIIGYMEWIFTARLDINQFLEYEARLNHVLPNYGDPVVCVYDCSKFDAEIVMGVLRTHPVVMIGGAMHRNPFFISPNEYLQELHNHQAGSLELQTDATAENLRLRRTMCDLLALSGMSATWTGRKPEQIAEEVVSLLVSGLQLETAHVRINRGDGTYVESMHSENWPQFSEWLKSADATQRSFVEMSLQRMSELTCGNKTLFALQVPIGIENETGYIAAGSFRPDFPTEMERLVLSAAANQGLVSFRNARLIHKREHVESKPGNIRELQNADRPHLTTGSLSERVIEYEREIIESSLQMSGGKVSGPTGAARRLGVPSTTLYSRIKALAINKNRYKSR
jgi:hypothetical protein